MFKVLFVCTGNICRSPTAEGIAKKLIKELKLEKKLFVDSAGTSSFHEGSMPDFRSLDYALKQGVDLRDLRARPVTDEDFAEFDLILVMDERNARELELKRPDFDERYKKAKVEKILTYAPEHGEDVPDPYYNDGFDKVFKMLDKAVKNLVKQLKL